MPITAQFNLSRFPVLPATQPKVPPRGMILLSAENTPDPNVMTTDVGEKTFIFNQPQKRESAFIPPNPASIPSLEK